VERLLREADDAGSPLDGSGAPRPSAAGEAGLTNQAPSPSREVEWRFAVADILDDSPSRELWISPDLAERYRPAMHVVDAADRRATCSCFTSAYGQAHIRSGSYLQTAEGLRRFSPREILRLLGFPAGFELPESLSRRQAWKLVGNSLSIFAVRAVLASADGAPDAMRAAFQPLAAGARQFTWDHSRPPSATP
jgi:DNA (cytosine-5)-methyltransferase 1/tRNA (cytosine38-C5)-methyltransferase